MSPGAPLGALWKPWGSFWGPCDYLLELWKLLFRPLTRPVGLARSRHAADPILIDFGLFWSILADRAVFLVVVSSIFVDLRVLGRFFVFSDVFGPQMDLG